MIGKGENDITAGKEAGCKTALVNGVGTSRITGDFEQNITEDN